MRRIIRLLALTLPLVETTSALVDKWVDKEGKVYYGNPTPLEHNKVV